MARFIIVFVLACTIGSAAAHGRHMHSRHTQRHAHIGIGVGIPFGAAWDYRPPDYYSYPYSYAYPPVVTFSPPPVYIEQHPPPATSSEESQYWWYYCQSAQAYYPYVQQGPQGWQRVAPQPSDLR